MANDLMDAVKALRTIVDDGFCIDDILTERRPRKKETKSVGVSLQGDFFLSNYIMILTQEWPFPFF